MPRFVILRHALSKPIDGRGSHWDLMLESDDGVEDSLETWALEDLPSKAGTTDARRLKPHRTEYLDYEGPVSQNRGSVKRVMAGTYTRTRLDGVDFAIEITCEERYGTVTFRHVAEESWQVTFDLAATNSGDLSN